MTVPIPCDDDIDDRQLRRLLGVLVDMIDGGARLTPSERCDAIEIALEVSTAEARTYALDDCDTCN